MPIPFEDDWTAIADQAVEDFRTLLRFDTRNPPGEEGPAIDFIKQRLAEEGIESTVLEHEGRPNLVARIEGDGSAGGPLLVAGHVDVVPVEPEHWICDPFAAEIIDGYIYGRGTVDMKHMVTMCMTAAMLTKRTGKKPNRDLIFAAVADEEAGCTHGSNFLVEEHPELVRADYMLGEFGGFPQDVGEHRIYPIQVAEKGNCKLKLTARGNPGHGSVPHKENAVVILAAAIAKLGTTRLPQHKVATVETFLNRVAEIQGGPAKIALPQLFNKLVSGVILDKLLPDADLAATFAANLSNTACPTMLDAGSAMNVIPGEASAIVDGRLIPGQRAEDLVREVQHVVGDHIEIEVLLSAPGREGTSDDPLYRMIEDTVRRYDPTGHPIPYMLTGFTDAMCFGRIVPNCFGFAPMQFPKGADYSFKQMVHGHNERIPEEGFRWGVKCFWDLVSRFLGVA